MRVAAVVVLSFVGTVFGHEAFAQSRPSTPEPPVYVIGPPPPLAGAPAGEDRKQHHERSPLSKYSAGMAISLGTLALSPSVAGLRFKGSGVPLYEQRRQSFDYTGRQLGLSAPMLWGGEMAIHYERRYLSVGGMVFMAGNPGGTDVQPVPKWSKGATQVDAMELLAMGAGIDMAAVLPLGPVDLRLGSVFGVRSFSLPMSGFQRETCVIKGRTTTCEDEASTDAQMFVEPRLALEVTPSKHQGFYFGAYVGMDVVGGSGPSGGIFIGGHSSSHDGYQ